MPAEEHVTSVSFAYVVPAGKETYIESEDMRSADRAVHDLLKVTLSRGPHVLEMQPEGRKLAKVADVALHAVKTVGTGLIEPACRRQRSVKAVAS